MLFLEMIGIALPGFITLMSLQEQQNQSRSILISFFAEKLTLFKETREILTSYKGQVTRFSVSIAYLLRMLRTVFNLFFLFARTQFALR